jgi:LCP family protein required for cell wall assembly
VPSPVVARQPVAPPPVAPPPVVARQPVAPPPADTPPATPPPDTSLGTLPPAPAATELPAAPSLTVPPDAVHPASVAVRPPMRSVSRALALSLASAALPGLGQALQRRWRPAIVIGIPTLALLAGIVWAFAQDPLTLVSWMVDPTLLGTLVVVGVAWAALCALAAADAGRTACPDASGPPRTRLAGQAVIALVAIAALLPGLAVSWVAQRQDSVLDTVFAGPDDESVIARPSPLSELGVTTTIAPAPTTSAPTTSATTPSTMASTTVSTPMTPGSVPPEPTLPRGTVPAVVVAPTVPPTLPPDEVGRWTIALIGGDAGPRRWGLRTDTMIVVSIDKATGDLTGISVPRNLRRLPMPAGPLRDRFPSGFDDLANALFPYVETHPELGLDASQSVKGALAELLGIPIDHYVLVDMVGFVRIIDALGGVTVELSRSIPLVPNIDGVTKEADAVGPGPVQMNGAMALAFARTRKIDSDYGRMQRQRCLLAAVARGTSPTALAQSYPAVASAVEGAFRSDIPRDRLDDLVRLFAKVDVSTARTLSLAPPVIEPGRPDIGYIRTLVARSLDPAAAATEPAVGSPAC